jgi:hypothetical protein
LKLNRFRISGLARDGFPRMAVDNLECGARRGTERCAQLLGEAPPGEPARPVGTRRGLP